MAHRHKPRPAAVAGVPMKANCRQCGVLITNQKNVGEDRNTWPGPKTDYLCMDCHMGKIDSLIERTRRELGLQGPGTYKRP
jgi:hypothetical protein